MAGDQNKELHKEASAKFGKNEFIEAYECCKKAKEKGCFDVYEILLKLVLTEKYFKIQKELFSEKEQVIAAEELLTDILSCVEDIKERGCVLILKVVEAFLGTSSEKICFVKLQNLYWRLNFRVFNLLIVKPPKKLKKKTQKSDVSEAVLRRRWRNAVANSLECDETLKFLDNFLPFLRSDNPRLEYDGFVLADVEINHFIDFVNNMTEQPDSFIFIRVYGLGLLSLKFLKDDQSSVLLDRKEKILAKYNGLLEQCLDAVLSNIDKISDFSLVILVQQMYLLDGELSEKMLQVILLLIKGIGQRFNSELLYFSVMCLRLESINSEIITIYSRFLQSNKAFKSNHYKESHAKIINACRAKEDVTNADIIENCTMQFVSADDSFDRAMGEMSKVSEEIDYDMALQDLEVAAKQGHVKAADKIVGLKGDGNCKAVIVFCRLAVHFSENSSLHDVREVRQRILGKRLRKIDVIKSECASTLESALSKDEGQTYDIAQLYYHGDNAFQKNLFIARHLFQRALASHDSRAHYWLGMMTVKSEGCKFDADTAIASLFEAKNCSFFPNRDAEVRFELARLLYCRVECALPVVGVDDGKDVLALIISLLKEAFKLNKCQKSLVMMFILTENPQYLGAKTVLREIVDKSADMVKEILVTNAQIDLKELNWLFPDSQINESNFNDLFREAKIQLDGECENIQKQRACHRPEKMLELLSTCESLNSQKVVSELTKYYALVKEGGGKLLSTICYVAHRYDVKSPYLRRLNELLSKAVEASTSVDNKVKVFSEMGAETLKSYREQLVKIETNGNTYFDEDPSDISDDEDDASRQCTDRRLTASKSEAEEISKKLEGIAIKSLTEIQSLPDDVDYKKQVKDLKSKFSSISWDQKRRPPKEGKGSLQQEINTLNRYKALGELDKGLMQVGTKFVVAMTRGNHFSLDKWNRSKRRGACKQILAENHPYLGLEVPVYSTLVYEVAKVTDYSDLRQITLLRLSIAALQIQMTVSVAFAATKIDPKTLIPDLSDDEMDELRVSKPEVEKLRNALKCPKLCFTLAEQIHQLYTNHYDLFHKFVGVCSKKYQPLSLLTANLFCSYARITCQHSAWYSNGIKYYDAEQEASRLRPNWDKNLKSHHHVSGYVMLGLFPVDDFATETVRDVVEATNLGSMNVEYSVLQEQEFSFSVLCKPGRICTIDLSKYPSFNGEYKSVYSVKYFISEDFFKSLQSALDLSKPHSVKRRLLTLFLGVYLSAAQNLNLNRIAIRKAESDGVVLLYLDRNGMFTLKKVNDVLPSPAGGEPERISRRYYNKYVRSGILSYDEGVSGKRKFPEEKMGSMRNRVGKPQHGYTRQAVAADGNCGFTAFGITREQALQSLTDGLKGESSESIIKRLQYAICGELPTERFRQYLVEHDQLGAEISLEEIILNMDQFANDVVIIEGYINYDVRDTKVGAGFAHPGVLQALAHIKGIDLRIWREGDGQALQPHRGVGYDYSICTPVAVNRRLDILFVNGNHFELLEFVGNTQEAADSGEPVYPLDSSWSQKMSDSEDDMGVDNSSVSSDSEGSSDSNNPSSAKKLKTTWNDDLDQAKEAAKSLQTDAGLLAKVEKAKLSGEVFELMATEISLGHALKALAIFSLACTDKKPVDSVVKKKDGEDNNIFHKAVLHQCYELVLLFNDKRTSGARPRTVVSFTEKNKSGDSPLDLAFRHYDARVFPVVWDRYTVNNHSTASHVKLSSVLTCENVQAMSLFRDHAKTPAVIGDDGIQEINTRINELR